MTVEDTLMPMAQPSAWEAGRQRAARLNEALAVGLSVRISANGRTITLSGRPVQPVFVAGLGGRVAVLQPEGWIIADDCQIIIVGARKI